MNRLTVVELDSGTNLQENFEATPNFFTFYRKRYPQFKDGDEFRRLLDMYINLKQTWINSLHGIIKFWLSCVEMIELLLNTIYAVRTGNWDLLLECAREMIPYYFAYNSVNYARYLTINKDMKTPGATTGFSTKIGAVKRWEITASYRANIRKCLHQHLCYNKQRYSHGDLIPPSIRRDENKVQAVVDVLTNVFIHPLSTMPFASISTGIIANENAAESMLEAKINGMNEMRKFINDKLQPGKTVSFLDPIKRNNTMTFVTIKKKRTCKIKNRVMSSESCKDLFLKISLIAQSRNIKIRELFAFPLGAVPLVFAEINGILKKTPKSALLYKLEADIPPVEDVTLNSAMIIDGMALVGQIRA